MDPQRQRTVGEEMTPAAQGRTVQLDGVTHQFPADATDDEIRQALGGGKPPLPDPRRKDRTQLNSSAIHWGVSALQADQFQGLATMTRPKIAPSTIAFVPVTVAATTRAGWMRCSPARLFRRCSARQAPRWQVSRSPTAVAPALKHLALRSRG